MIKKLKQKLYSRSNKNNEDQDTGFTLIEMLVVVTIVGLLSSIAYTSVQSARIKATDKAIIASLEGISLQARAVYEKNGCYATSVGACTGYLQRGGVAYIQAVRSGGGCLDGYVASNPNTHWLWFDPIIRDTVTGLVAIANGMADSVACTSSAQGRAWAISAKLKSDPSKRWCVDSVRNSRMVVEGQYMGVIPGSMIPGLVNDFGFAGSNSYCK